MCVHTDTHAWMHPSMYTKHVHSKSQVKNMLHLILLHPATLFSISHPSYKKPQLKLPKFHFKAQLNILVKMLTTCWGIGSLHTTCNICKNQEYWKYCHFQISCDYVNDSIHQTRTQKKTVASAKLRNNHTMYHRIVLISICFGYRHNTCGASDKEVDYSEGDLAEWVQWSTCLTWLPVKIPLFIITSIAVSVNRFKTLQSYLFHVLIFNITVSCLRFPGILCGLYRWTKENTATK